MTRTTVTGQYARTPNGRTVWYEYAYTAVRPDRPIPDNVIQLANQREALRKQPLTKSNSLPYDTAHGHTKTERQQRPRRETTRTRARGSGVFPNDSAVDHENDSPYWYER